MIDKKRLLSVCAVIFFVMAFSACSKKGQEIMLDVDQHPVCQSVFIDLNEAYDEVIPDMESYIQANDMKVEITNDDMTIVYGSNNKKLFIGLYDKENVFDSSICINTDIDLSFVDFAILSSEHIVGLANDELNQEYMVDIVNDSVTAYQLIEGDRVHSMILSFNGGVALISSESVDYYDSNLNYKTSYGSEHTICGITSNCDKLYVMENSGESISFGVLMGTDLDYTQLASLNISGESYYSYVHPNDISIVYVSDSEFVISTKMSIFEVNTDDLTSRTLINTYDYGIEYPPRIISVDDNTILALVGFYDVSCGKNRECLAEMVFDFDDGIKTQISVAIIGTTDYLEYFQSINRTSEDYYVSIEVFEEGLSDDEYAEIITNDSFDVLVYDDTIKNDLITNGYLRSLNELDIDLDGVMEDMRELMYWNDNMYYIFPDYSVNMNVYNSNIWNDRVDDAELLSVTGAKELFANQDITMMAEQYCGILVNEYEASGSVSYQTIQEYLLLCSAYESDYYESDTMINSIFNGDFIYLSERINNIEQFYSVFCYFGGNIGFRGPLGFDAPVIIPHSYISVSSSTNKVEECKEILEFFLEVDIQNTFELPVNEASLRAAIDQFISGCTEENAEQYILDYPLYSDCDNTSISNEYTILADAMQNGTHTEDMEGSMSSNNLPNGIRILVDEYELNLFGNLFYDAISSSNKTLYVDSELIQIMEEEATAYVSNSENIDYRAEILYERVMLYINENWELN